MESMAASDLHALFKLHQIDAAIVDIRRRAAALDPGREIMTAIRALEVERDAARAEAQALGSELAAKEQLDRDLKAKLAKLDKQLFGGGVVNAKEAENMEKEMAHVREQMAGIEARMLELYESVPPAQKALEQVERRIAAKKLELTEHHRKVMQLKERLEAEFKQRVSERPLFAKSVSPGLLKQYEAIRERTGGVGMAEVDEKKSCGRCGMALPERTIANLKEDRLTTCESCHRILYRVVP
jgi:predicted  nucleic acid-binding Zn-ribbon protein